MINIHTFRKIDLGQIGNASLKEKLESLLDMVKDDTPESLKGDEEVQKAMNSLYELVKKFFPKALPEKEKGVAKKPRPKEKPERSKEEPSQSKPKPKEKETEKKESEPAKTDAQDKDLLEELKTLEPKLENCRRVIREHNAKKKEAQGPKPQPTRHTQLKNKLLSIVSLIPDKLEKDEEVMEATKDILLDTHSKLIETWGMDKKKAKPGAAAIEEKFDSIEEKKEKEERKKVAKRWKNQLPDVDSLMRKEWKDSEGLENEAKEMLDDLKEAIKLFEKDAKKAQEFLIKRYSKEQLDRHLPDFILEQLNL